ncbi:MAG: hypothetical protein M3328_14550, partial [Chloroflexota bacterium]|nr:hypothetical protein [Chloroflexota bacterium]
MNSERRGFLDPRVATIALGLLLAAVLFVGSTFAAAPTKNSGSRTAQARQGHPPNAPEALVVVRPSNMDGWATTNGHCSGGTPTGSVGFVTGPGSPPLGVGSFQFTTGTDGDSFPNIRNSNYHGIKLSQINAFSYNTYVSAPITNSGQAPYIILNIDNNGDNAVDEQLFFEPAYQKPAYGPVPDQCPGMTNCVALNTWQHWDAKLGGWWVVTNGGPPVMTLQTYAAANPNARIINSISGLGGVRFVAGCGGSTWANFVGNIDNVTIGYGPLPTATNTALPSATSTATGTSTSTATEEPSATTTATPTETTIVAPNAPQGGPPPSDFTTYDMEPDPATATSTETSTSTTVPSSTSTTVPSSTSTTAPSSTSTTAATSTSTTAPSNTATRTATTAA